jgi:hypothetical protein
VSPRIQMQSAQDPIAQNVIDMRPERPQYQRHADLLREHGMLKVPVCSLAGLIGCTAAVLAQAKPGPVQQPGRVVYESLAPGVLGARAFTSDALNDVTIEVSEVMLGPGKSAPNVPVRGVAMMELKSGEVETTIDSLTVRRRPGDFWVVRSGQHYAIKNLGGQVVIQAFSMTRRR